MQDLVKDILKSFKIITWLTAGLALLGVTYLWFFMEEKTSLPYLDWMFYTIITEIAAVTFIFTKKGIKYLPDVQVNKCPTETLHFMRDFVSQGSSATIVSHRVSWLLDDKSIAEALQKKIQKGLRVEIITPKEVEAEIKALLTGANFIVTNESVAPDSRFTLVNGERSGSELLAIARGTHPTHEITIFDTNSGPQIIAMAKDIIRKSKELANVR